MRQQTHDNFSSSWGVAPPKLVATLPSILDMPFLPDPPIERVSGARLRAVGSQSQLSAGAFGYATGSVLRISSGFWHYSALVPLRLPSPCRGPPQFLPSQVGYPLSHRKHTLPDSDLVSILCISPNTSRGDPDVLFASYKP